MRRSASPRIAGAKTVGNAVSEKLAWVDFDEATRRAVRAAWLFAQGCRQFACGSSP
ncbi:hypothetical protein BQ8482_110553 [Mesorhizobium delmotii]|uniref:Uncharacterized protein n=1 Tax=Mesorhizobium delmotii TaxID=1631247 RepID=A0A2P9ABY1_9HYPH|nr:hypothetical protein BQ8482_110553 [Mesorhizobium delmotii]